MEKKNNYRLLSLLASLLGATWFLVLLFFLLSSRIPDVAASTLMVACSSSELVSAINIANSPSTSDTLLLSEGCTYVLDSVDNVTDGANGLPSITGRVVISGNGAVIERSDAAAPFRLLHIAANGALTLTDVTLRNGLLEGNGLPGSGAALFNRGQLNLVASTVVSNTSSDYDGGGLVNTAGGSASLALVSFISNTANFDGGAIINLGGSLSMDQTLFQDNVAGRGGAIMSDDGQVYLNRASFTGNRSDLGGAIYQFAGTVAVNDGRLIDNEGSSGGGSVLVEDTGLFTATNTIFTNNAGEYGGAILNDSSNIWLTNVSLAGNVAQFGGGLSMFGGESEIRNSILWDNQAPNGPQIMRFGGSTFIGYTLLQGSGGSGGSWDADLGQDGGGNLDANPAFVHLPDREASDDGDLHLTPGSPAIDAGENDPSPVVLPAADLDGNPRRDDIPSAANVGAGTPPIVDLGAYEAQNVAPVSLADSYSTNEDSTLAISQAISGVLANDSDQNGDTLSAILADDVSSGTLWLKLDGTLVYTPAAGFVGQDTFTYWASDGILSGPATVVTLTVNEVLNPPVAQPDHYMVDSGQTLVVNAPGLLANDNPGDAVSLSAALGSGPAHGQLDLNSTGAFTYTADPGFSGLDTFTYRAEGSNLFSEPVLVSIDVNAKIFLPIIIRG